MTIPEYGFGFVGEGVELLAELRLELVARDAPLRNEDRLRLDDLGCDRRAM